MEVGLMWVPCLGWKAVWKVDEETQMPCTGWRADCGHTAAKRDGVSRCGISTRTSVFFLDCLRIGARVSLQWLKLTVEGG